MKKLGGVPENNLGVAPRSRPFFFVFSVGSNTCVSFLWHSSRTTLMYSRSCIKSPWSRESLFLLSHKSSGCEKSACNRMVSAVCTAHRAATHRSTPTLGPLSVVLRVSAEVPGMRARQRVPKRLAEGHRKGRTNRLSTPELSMVCQTSCAGGFLDIIRTRIGAEMAVESVNKCAKKARRQGHRNKSTN